MLSSSTTARTDVEDVAREALQALRLAAPRIEAQGRKLERLPAALPLPKGVRLQRLALTRRLRQDLATAQAAVDVVLKLGAEPRDGGRLPQAFAKALQEQGDDLVLLVAMVKRRHATEEAVLALDTAVRGLLPDELALLVEALESARASLSWIRYTITKPLKEPTPSSVAQRLRKIRRELARVWWAWDIIHEVESRVSVRASPPSPARYGLEELQDPRRGSRMPGYGRQTARPPWTVEQVSRWLSWGVGSILLWRRRARALRAHDAVRSLYAALREEAVYAGYCFIPEPRAGNDPRVLPLGDAGAAASNADTSTN